MEMQTKKEIPLIIPFPAIMGSKSNPSEKTSKQGTTEFSSKLSAELDSSANRQLSAHKVSDKQKPDELKKAENDGRDTSLPMAIVPGIQENANLLLNLGTELLTGLKDFAVQSVAAAVIPQVPLLLAVTGQLLTSEPTTPGQTVTGPAGDLADASKTAPIMGQRVVVPLVPSSSPTTVLAPTADGAEKQVLATPAVTTQTATPTGESKGPLSGAPVLFSSATNQPEANPVPNADPLVASAKVSVDRPEAMVFLTPNSNGNLNVGQKISLESANPLQNLIQQDLVSAQINLNPVRNPIIHANTATNPASNSEQTDSGDSAPVTLINEAAVPVVAVSTEPKDQSEQSLAQAKAEQKPTLSDKQDASAMAPVMFDKVLASTNEMPASVPPPVQPRQDLHEVVKQVMDGMVSPTQQLKSSQVIITLKPEHLGEVTMKINVDGDKVTASFHAASSEVRAILESSLPQLRQEMSQQGWQFDSNGVFGGMQEFLANQGQQQAQQQQMLGNIQQRQREEYDDAMSFTHNGRLQVMSAAAVDYRI